jgi:hypothetical protein
VILKTKPGRGHGVVINSDNDNDHQHNEDEIHEFLGIFNCSQNGDHPLEDEEKVASIPEKI